MGDDLESWREDGLGGCMGVFSAVIALAMVAVVVYALVQAF